MCIIIIIINTTNNNGADTTNITAAITATVDNGRGGSNTDKNAFF